MSRPKLVLFDEPSLGLAPNIVERTFEIIKEIRGEGVTVVMVEQNAFAALELSDRSYVLEQGRVTLAGTGTELLEQSARQKRLPWRVMRQDSAVRHAQDRALRAFRNDRTTGRELHNDRIDRHDIARLPVHAGHGAVALCQQDVFHLHRLDDTEYITRFDPL